MCDEIGGDVQHGSSSPKKGSGVQSIGLRTNYSRFPFYLSVLTTYDTEFPELGFEVNWNLPKPYFTRGLPSTILEFVALCDFFAAWMPFGSEP